MIELDYPHLERACCRALCRHQVSELENVIALSILRLSFGIGEPFLRLDHAVELSRLTGLSKGKAHEVVRRLVRGRALQVSADRCIYTFLPPSKAWPWLFAERVEMRTADELERAIVWANKGGARQGELFSPPADQEFEEALAVERMRESLIEYHQAATARFAGGLDFSVTDRLPTSAPGLQDLSSGEGQTRPLETAVAGVSTSAAESFTRRPEEASEMLAPRSRPDSEGGSRIGNPVPESGTALLKDFKVLKQCTALNPLKLSKPGSRIGNPLPPLDPGVTEDEIVAWLHIALGKMCGPCFEARCKCQCEKPEWVPVMEKLGGWWRIKIRESRWAALNVCMELRLRMTDTHLKPLRNRGGWARDQYFRLRGEELEATETPGANLTTES